MKHFYNLHYLFVYILFISLIGYVGYQIYTLNNTSNYKNFNEEDITINDDTTDETTKLTTNASTKITNTTKKIINTTTKVTSTTTKEISYGTINHISNNGSLIPDKYNSGIYNKSSIKKFVFNETELPVKVNESTMNTGSEIVPALIIPIQHNQGLSGTVTISNVDFSSYVLRMYNYDIQNKLTIVFDNCIFGSFIIAPELNDNITVIVKNSNLYHLSGSNITVQNCLFNLTVSDGINPYRNVTVKNSYFVFNDIKNSDKEIHIDGVQIYGKKDVLAENIHFDNVRMEIPYIKSSEASKAYVNAPIMLQLEYEDGNNISFSNMYINGGGFSIYSHAIKGTSYSNISFKNIYVGQGYIYGLWYPKNDYSEVTITNVNETSNLYVTSIWKDDRGVHIITTNDTREEKTLTCKTNKGTFEFKMSAHPVITKDNSYTIKFEDLPYDVDNLIKDKTITNLSCYDNDTLIISKNL